MGEPFDIVINDPKPNSNVYGIEVPESDPVIDTGLPASQPIFRGSSTSSRSYNPRAYNEPNYVTIPVDFRTKPGHSIKLEWRKDNVLLRTGRPGSWSARTSLRIYQYDRKIEGIYHLRIIDETTGRYAETQTQVMLR